jgi:hypothetical protein
MVVNLSEYSESKKAQALAVVDAFRSAQKAETVRRAKLEWILADLLADIEAA